MINKENLGLNFQEEKIFLKKIHLNGREIYPLLKLSIIYSENSMAMISLDPIAWLVIEEIEEKVNLKEEYLIIFDSEFDSETLFKYFEEELTTI